MKVYLTTTVETAVQLDIMYRYILEPKYIVCSLTS